MTTEYEDDVPVEHVNDLTPLTRAEIEPMMLIDVSSSMGEAAAPGSRTTRKDVVEELLGAIVQALEGEDSQAEAERAAGADEAEIGGVYTITFSTDATDMGDLNSANLQQKKREIPWGGNTHIVTGWEMLVDHYVEEFGDRPKQDRPKLGALVITDGEAHDGEQYADILAQQGNDTYVAVAIIGYGKPHDNTLAQYTAIAKQNQHVRVLSFDAVTSGHAIAQDLLALLGK